MAVTGITAKKIRRARIPIVARSKALQSEVGYIDARPLSPILQIPLATHGRSIHRVKTGRSRPPIVTSAPEGEADETIESAAIARDMSAVGGRADAACQGLSGPFIAEVANTGHSVVLPETSLTVEQTKPAEADIASMMSGCKLVVCEIRTVRIASRRTNYSNGS